MTGQVPVTARRGLLYAAAAGITAALTAAPDSSAAPPPPPDRPRPDTPWAACSATAQPPPRRPTRWPAAGLAGLCARLRGLLGGRVEVRYGHAFGTAPVLVGPVTADGHPVTFDGRPPEWLADQPS
ncbi:SGNH hydrolase OS=Streptomyces microflavus OX=1919 GN=Smic_82300 PE=4 SV=1 [Streptomyces microflavus]